MLDRDFSCAIILSWLHAKIDFDEHKIKIYVKKMYKN